jgi:hypothetical protein
VIDDPTLRACLASNWALPDAQVEAHEGGMGSATWLVSQARRRWVAKAVTPALRAPFAGGLSVAALLDSAGIPAGAPVPTLDGRSVVNLDAASLALLTWVEGRPLTGSGAEERRDPRPGPPGPTGRHRPRSTALPLGPARRRPPGAPTLDPPRGHRRRRRSGPAGLSLAHLGPAPLRPGPRALPAGPVQADYFARRITNHDLTGIAGPADNEKGLEDARRRLG